MRLGNKLETILPGSPHRLPEWRWLTAQRIRKNKKQSQVIKDSEDPEDQSLYSAIQFMDQVESCQSDEDFTDLYRKKPVEFIALTFWIDPVSYRARLDDQPTIVEIRRQATLEAYLLAKLRHDEIAHKLCVTPETVGLYENWFFDFRSFIHSESWISTYALRSDMAGSSSCKFEGLLRLCGWKHGSGMVDELLSSTKYSEETIKILEGDSLGHLLKSTTIMARAPRHEATAFEAARGFLEARNRLKEAEIQAGKDYRSNDERDWIVGVEKEMADGKWAVVDVPYDVEKALPAVEKRLAVRLGYEKDLSSYNHVPVDSPTPQGP